MSTVDTITVLQSGTKNGRTWHKVGNADGEAVFADLFTPDGEEAPALRPNVTREYSVLKQWRQEGGIRDGQPQPDSFTYVIELGE